LVENAPRKRPVSAAELRIRLEGAAETLDKAVERYQWARRLLRKQWRSRAGRHASALERMKNEEPLIEEAVKKVERLIEREGWDEGSEPQQLLERVRRARAELIAHLDPMLSLATPLTETGRFSSAFATGRIQWMLEYLLAEAVPPSTSEPLVSAPLAVGQSFRAAAMIVASLAIGVTVSLLLSRFGLIFTFFLIGPTVAAPAALWRRWSRLDVLPDRLRVRRPFGEAIEVRLPKGGIHYEPYDARLSIAGLGTLQLHSVDDAAAIATLIELFTHPPFDSIRGIAASDAIVLEASRTTGRNGVLVLAGERVLFIEDGPAAFDSAAGTTSTWASPKARLLARSVLALPDPARTTMIDRLLLSGSAQEIALKTDLLVSRGALRVGDVKVDLTERLARDVKRWSNAR